MDNGQLPSMSRGSCIINIDEKRYLRPGEDLKDWLTSIGIQYTSGFFAYRIIKILHWWKLWIQREQ